MNNNKPGNISLEGKQDNNNLTTDQIVQKWQEEKSLRIAIENALPSGIAVIDDSGKQIYANKAFCQMIGWNEEELVGMYPPYPYWAPQDIDNINNALKLTLGNNAPKEGFDLVFCHKTGRLVPVNVIIAPFIQEDNRTYWVANVIDITERKREEEDLKRSRVLLKSSMESQKGTIIFAIGLDYHYLFFNKAHYDSMKYAYGIDVSVGMNILECINKADDKRLAKENYDRALKGESFTSIQSFGNVNVAYYESFFNPILNDNNEIIGCTGLARDITERKQAELALRENEMKFKEIINQIADGIIVFDEQEKIIIWNEGAQQICEIDEDSLLNTGIADIYYRLMPVSHRDRGLIESEIYNIKTLQTPEIFNQIIDNEIITLKTRTLKNVQRKVFPIKLNGYNLFCMVFRDTTEIKRYEKELIRISADKDKFYSVIAQHLYAPFNSFHNFSKLMSVELDDLPIKEIQKMASRMSKSATNLYTLLDNLLQWTKINQGNITFNPQILNLIKTSKEALSILKNEAGMKNVAINHIADEEISVFADVFMLKTIIRNLVSNSIRYASVDGNIDITARQTDSNVTVILLDRVSGLTPQYYTELFRSSEIHTALDTAEEKGTTLGLILCKEFVEKHSGKIWAEKADTNDKSIEIKFTLPVFNRFTDHTVI